MNEQILILCCLLSIQLAATPATRRVPVTIEVLQDVTLRRPDPSLKNQRHQRDVLDGPNRDPIVIKKGMRFRMIEILAEGECTIEFERRQYTLSSCWWLDGFTDHHEDVYKVVPRR